MNDPVEDEIEGLGDAPHGEFGGEFDKEYVAYPM